MDFNNYSIEQLHAIYDVLDYIERKGALMDAHELRGLIHSLDRTSSEVRHEKVCADIRLEHQSRKDLLDLFKEF